MELISNIFSLTFYLLVVLLLVGAWINRNNWPRG